jgi:hypothetical protein
MVMQFSNRKKNNFSFQKIVIICVIIVLFYLLIPFLRKVTLHAFSALFKKSNQISDAVVEKSLFRSKVSMRREIENLKEENQRLTLGLQHSSRCYSL